MRYIKDIEKSIFEMLTQGTKKGLIEWEVKSKSRYNGQINGVKVSVKGTEVKYGKIKFFSADLYNDIYLTVLSKIEKEIRSNLLLKEIKCPGCESLKAMKKDDILFYCSSCEKYYSFNTDKNIWEENQVNDDEINSVTSLEYPLLNDDEEEALYEKAKANIEGLKDKIDDGLLRKSETMGVLSTEIKEASVTLNDKRLKEIADNKVKEAYERYFLVPGFSLKDVNESDFKKEKTDD